MNSTRNDHQAEQVRLIVRKINDAWLAGRTAELDEYFHTDIVIKWPGLKEMGRGREACVKSYEDFISQAKVRNFQQLEPQVGVWGSTAVADYSWTISYEMNGQDHNEAGQDLMVFVQEDGKWLVAWRAVLAGP